MPVLQPFTPSIDWSHAVPDSFAWIAQAWLTSAVCVFVVFVVLRFTTQWARQYWRITGAYFSGPRSVRVWLILSVLLLLVIATVRINVLFSYFSKDLYNALETAFTGSGAQNELVKQSGMHGFWVALAVFCILAATFIAIAMVDLYVMQRFIIAWRVWLTNASPPTG